MGIFDMIHNFAQKSSKAPDRQDYVPMDKHTMESVQEVLSELENEFKIRGNERAAAAVREFKRDLIDYNESEYRTAGALKAIIQRFQDNLIAAGVSEMEIDVAAIISGALLKHYPVFVSSNADQNLRESAAIKSEIDRAVDAIDVLQYMALKEISVEYKDRRRKMQALKDKVDNLVSFNKILKGGTEEQGEEEQVSVSYYYKVITNKNLPKAKIQELYNQAYHRLQQLERGNYFYKDSFIFGDDADRVLDSKYALIDEDKDAGISIFGLVSDEDSEVKVDENGKEYKEATFQNHIVVKISMPKDLDNPSEHDIAMRIATAAFFTENAVNDGLYGSPPPKVSILLDDELYNYIQKHPNVIEIANKYTKDLSYEEKKMKSAVNNTQLKSQITKTLALRDEEGKQFKDYLYELLILARKKRIIQTLKEAAELQVQIKDPTSNAAVNKTGQTTNVFDQTKALQMARKILNMPKLESLDKAEEVIDKNLNETMGKIEKIAKVNNAEDDVMLLTGIALDEEANGVLDDILKDDKSKEGVRALRRVIQQLDKSRLIASYLNKDPKKRDNRLKKIALAPAEQDKIIKYLQGQLGYTIITMRKVDNAKELFDTLESKYNVSLTDFIDALLYTGKQKQLVSQKELQQIGRQEQIEKQDLDQIEQINTNIAENSEEFASAIESITEAAMSRDLDPESRVIQQQAIRAINTQQAYKEVQRPIHYNTAVEMDQAAKAAAASPWSAYFTTSEKSFKKLKEIALNPNMSYGGKIAAGTGVVTKEFAVRALLGAAALGAATFFLGKEGLGVLKDNPVLAALFMGFLHLAMWAAIIYVATQFALAAYRLFRFYLTMRKDQKSFEMSKANEPFKTAKISNVKPESLNELIDSVFSSVKRHDEPVIKGTLPRRKEVEQSTAAVIEAKRENIKSARRKRIHLKDKKGISIKTPTSDNDAITSL
jgi:hypothetical protein